MTNLHVTFWKHVFVSKIYLGIDSVLENTRILFSSNSVLLGAFCPVWSQSPWTAAVCQTSGGCVRSQNFRSHDRRTNASYILFKVTQGQGALLAHYLLEVSRARWGPPVALTHPRCVVRLGSIAKLLPHAVSALEHGSVGPRVPRLPGISSFELSPFLCRGGRTRWRVAKSHRCHQFRYRHFDADVGRQAPAEIRYSDSDSRFPAKFADEDFEKRWLLVQQETAGLDSKGTIEYSGERERAGLNWLRVTLYSVFVICISRTLSTPLGANIIFSHPLSPHMVSPPSVIWGKNWSWKLVYLTIIRKTFLIDNGITLQLYRNLRPLWRVDETTHPTVVPKAPWNIHCFWNHSTPNLAAFETGNDRMGSGRVGFEKKKFSFTFSCLINLN